MSSHPIRMLFWIREEFPTHRVDVDVLFGRELIGRGHAIDFVMQADSAKISPGPHSWSGRTVFVGPTATGGVLSRFAKHGLALCHDMKSLQFARSERYDALQVRDKFFFAVIALWIAHRRGLKFFYWLSFPYPEADRLHARSGETRFPFLANLRGIISGWLLYHWILPHANHVFVQSDRMKQDIVGKGYNAQTFTTVPMGVDLRDIAQLAERGDHASGGLLVLGYLGALNADRHLDVLIDMLADLRHTGCPVKLLLVGEASEREDRRQLERRAEQLGLSKFLEITGMLPRAQALQRMQEVDIALSPIYPSPVFLLSSPTKLVEYLALSLPVVASEHPEQRFVLHMSGAGVCAPWGGRYFARSVRWLLRRSRQERAAMGAGGRLWIEEHRTYARIADNLERKYAELLPRSLPACRVGDMTH
jgi:glycosyltransferase involved in cell wall biosynthesis